MDKQHAQFPFSGLHVYQRAQEAWTRACKSSNVKPLQRRLETEIGRAVLGIARATARSNRRGDFRAELEDARGAIHAAGATADQLSRRGMPVEGDLHELLSDAARMLGALIQTLQATEETITVSGDENGPPVPAGS